METASRQAPVLHIGEFDAERQWQNGDAAKLPAVADQAADTILECMDEMLFTCTQPGDILATKHSIHSAVKAYHHALGLGIQYVHTPVESGKASVFTAFSHGSTASVQLPIWLQQASIYAMVPAAQDFLQNNNLVPFGCDDPEIVRRVNSKRFSWQLNQELGIPESGTLIQSIDELRRYASVYLDQTPPHPILLKEWFGVSGKGNLLISSHTLLDRVIRHLKKKQDAGQVLELLAEPYHDKQADFSCQMFLHSNGKVKLYGLQLMHNAGRAFSAVENAPFAFQNAMESKGYFLKLEKALAALHREGYSGNICIDSMVLADGNVYPIVEINARKSMGYLNYSVHKWYQHWLGGGLESSRKAISRLAFYNLSVPATVGYSQVLNQLHKVGLLFQPGLCEGILPLSGNCLDVNKPREAMQNIAYRGRLYYCVLAQSRDALEQLEQRLAEVLESMQIRKI